MNREKRKKRVRIKIKGSKIRPRLAVFRSSKYIYAQLIDDETGKTLVAASEKSLTKEQNSPPAGGQGQKTKEMTKVEKAKIVGEVLAQKALAQKIIRVVFDRGPYKYHGRVRALAEGARQRGLNF